MRSGRAATADLNGTPRRRDEVRAAVLGCVLGSILSSCAIIEENHVDGTTKRSIALASVVSVAPPAPDRARVLRISGLGLAFASGGSTVGYFDRLETVLDPNCQVVLVGNSNAQLERFATLTHGGQTLCSANTSAQEQ